LSTARVFRWQLKITLKKNKPQKIFWGFVFPEVYC